MFFFVLCLYIHTMRINYNILNISIFSRFVSFILLIKCSEINFDLKFSIIYKPSIIYYNIL